MPLIARAALVSTWTLGSRVLGLLRDRILAGAFGGSLVLDAFFVAFALPNLFRNLFGEGALSAAFLPRYVQMRAQDPAGAEAFAGVVLARLAAWLGLVAAAGMVATGILAQLVERDTKLWWVCVLAIPQLPYLTLICVAGVVAGILNGRRRFAVPAAAPAVLNVVLIGAVLWREDIAVLPWAVLGAGVLQLGLQAVALARSGGVPRFSWRATPALRELRGSVLPVLLATGVYQLNALLDSIIAYTLLPAGAVAFLYFANRLFQFPLALVAHGVGTAVYPELAAAAPRGWAQSGVALREASGLMTALLLPAAVGLFLVAEPLVRTVYQTGAFDEDAVARTTLATRMFALALVPVAYAKIFVRVFHAHRQQRVPMWISIASVALNLALNIVLVLATDLREAGLALATALSSLFGCAWMGLLLLRRGSGALVSLRAMVLPAVGSIGMAVAVAAVLWSWQPEAGGTAVHAARLAVAVGCGVAVYGAIAGPLALRALRRRRAQRAEEVEAPADGG